LRLLVLKQQVAGMGAEGFMWNGCNDLKF
jgi:hypothetical protein